MTVKLPLESEAPADLLASDPPSVSPFPSMDQTTWPPVGIDLVGVSPSGFIVDGVGTLSPEGVSDMVITDLRRAPCYDQDAGFLVVATDSNIRAAIKAEIELSNSVWIDPSNRLTDRYVPPNKFVQGWVASDGANVTVSLRLIDGQGKEQLNKSYTGPSEDFLIVYQEALNQFVTDMCGPKLPLRITGVFVGGTSNETTTYSWAGEASFLFDQFLYQPLDPTQPTSASYRIDYVDVQNFAFKGSGGGFTWQGSGSRRFNQVGSELGRMLMINLAPNSQGKHSYAVIFVASQPDAITYTVDCPNSTNTETADIYADLIGQDDEFNGLHTTDLIQFQGTHSRYTDYWKWDFVTVKWRKASE